MSASPRVLAVVLAALPLATSPGCSSSTSATAPGCTRDYWVATDGDDAADGSTAHPFRTLERARLAVRADATRGQCTIQVNVRSGTYRLAVPLDLDALDSGASGAPVVYRSAPGNVHPVVLSGGIVVERLDCSTWICKATVPEWPAGRVARQLYVDGARAIRVRSDYDPARTLQADNPVYARVDWGYELPLGAVAPDLHHPEYAEVVTITQWKMMRCPLQGFPGTDLVPDRLCWWNANTYPAPWNFQLLSWIENAPEYLRPDRPGMWFLDPATKELQYVSYGGTTPAEVVLPVLETLVNVVGSPGAPVTDVTFRGLQFSHATWFGPNADGYVADQSGNFVKGQGYLPNLTGHQRVVYSTPGNVNLRFAHRIRFENDVFSHLGAMAVWMGTGTQDSAIVDSQFTDVSSSAVQLGGADIQVNLRADADSVVSGNTVANNDISYTGRDYYDTAAIFFLFTSGTTVEHNTIRHVPWTGIATGWGWGLLDEGGFPGMPYAQKDEWGVFTTPTVTRNNRIASNRISHFLEQLWDGGAVYINGSQGWSPDDGLVLVLNVADGKRPEAGSNVFYTDAGTRYVTMDRNVSMTNPVGIVDFGSCATPSTWEFSRSAELLIRRFGDTELTRWLIAILDGIAGGLCSVTNLEVSYGADFGGCVPRGHLTYTDNYFAQPIHFFDICTEHLSVPVAIPDVSIRNIAIQSESDVPAWILEQAGKREGGSP